MKVDLTLWKYSYLHLFALNESEFINQKVSSKHSSFWLINLMLQNCKNLSFFPILFHIFSEFFFLWMNWMKKSNTWPGRHIWYQEEYSINVNIEKSKNWDISSFSTATQELNIWMRRYSWLNLVWEIFWSKLMISIWFAFLCKQQ